MGQAFGCVRVQESTVAVKETCGKFDEVLHPGCHCFYPCLGSRIAGHLSLREHQLDVMCKTRTKDNVFVAVEASVHYGVTNVNHAFYRLENPMEQLKTHAINAIHGAAQLLNMNDTFQMGNDLENAVKEQLDKVMNPNGYEIKRVLIKQIEPDEKVNETNAATTMEAENEAAFINLAGLGAPRQARVISDGARDTVHVRTYHLDSASLSRVPIQSDYLSR